MRCVSRKLVVVAVVLVGLTAFAPVAQAAPRAGAAAGLWAQVWSWLAGVWEKEGPILDPLGVPSAAPASSPAYSGNLHGVWEKEGPTCDEFGRPGGCAASVWESAPASRGPAEG